jgi:Holliday junction resolvase
MVFWKYGKGSKAERELMHIFLEKGYSVVRSAGSGVGFPSPDILVFKGPFQYAFECKAWHAGELSLRKEKVQEMLDWEKNTGMKSMIAWRVQGSGAKGWMFIELNKLREREKSYSIKLEELEGKAVTLWQILGE